MQSFKKYFIFILFLGFVNLEAQVKITYNFSINKGSYLAETVLFIKADSSVYYFNPQKQTNIIDKNNSESNLIKNYFKKNIVYSGLILGKEFLVTDSLNKYQWKIEADKKEILGYSC